MFESKVAVPKTSGGNFAYRWNFHMNPQKPVGVHKVTTVYHQSKCFKACHSLRITLNIRVNPAAV